MPTEALSGGARLVFIHGPAAAGKLTIAREVAELTGFGLFHNHIVVDALLRVFEFGSASFVELREAMWLTVFDTAASQGKSLVFTFAPEKTVAADFPERVQALLEAAGGRVDFVRLTVSEEEQERRLNNASRHEFRKLTDVDALRRLRSQFAAAEASMPAADLTFDTTSEAPASVARKIVAGLQLRPQLQS